MSLGTPVLGARSASDLLDLHLHPLEYFLVHPATCKRLRQLPSTNYHMRDLKGDESQMRGHQVSRLGHRPIRVPWNSAPLRPVIGCAQTEPLTSTHHLFFLTNPLA